MKKNRLILVVSIIIVVAVSTFFIIRPLQGHDNKKSRDSVLDIKIDFNQDLTKLSLQDLRLLKSSMYAKQGYLFMEADLRSYFSHKYFDYDSLIFAKYWEANGKEMTMKFTDQEKEFISKIDNLIQLRLKNNFQLVEGRELANADNIINLYQLEKYSLEFYQKLMKNNFVIVPEKDIQLFHAYEKNDYQQFPNFITTDLFLQAFHTYFEWVIKSIEKKQFTGLVTSLSEKMYHASSVISKSPDPELRENAAFIQTYFAIALGLISDKNPAVPASYAALYKQEMSNIEKEKDNISEFLGITDRYYLYSLYKPRGHYTRSPELKKYFKSMIWLQTASMCMKKDKDIKKAMLMAFILNESDNKSIMQLYMKVYKPTIFFFGEADNVSVLDLSSILESLNINEISQLYNAANLAKVKNNIIALYRQKDRIRPKIIQGCEGKIDFMPQRYLPDNEILSNMYDSTRNAARAYPSGLDVMAAFGNKYAEKLLYSSGEDRKWKEFSTTLNKMKNKFSNYNQWNDAVYNKWLESLVFMQKSESSYPLFMQTDQWKLKDMNTSLASWAELKHDACLYAEQPTGAECGGGGPPPPILMSYVEPNINFWSKSVDLVNLTIRVLNENGLYSDDIKSKTEDIREKAVFLNKISYKELNKTKVTDEEFNTMERIGASFEYLTLSIIEPDTMYQSWELVKGPDRSVAIVTDIFTRNIPGCNKNGILHVANGLVNYIYVVVEINGYLYISKGSTLNYFEFIEPNARLNDEEWQEKIEKNNYPSNPAWLDEILLKDTEVIKHDEKLFYSSGC